MVMPKERLIAEQIVIVLRLIEVC
ncbi:hypothetical protein NB311A_09681 [Nitrobacter sp. Nb-311A]|nr:hypothetical protein NB311A_09681 [Nitrobacter sp. Nb-311A]